MPEAITDEALLAKAARKAERKAKKQLATDPVVSKKRKTEEILEEVEVEIKAVKKKSKKSKKAEVETFVVPVEAVEIVEAVEEVKVKKSKKSKKAVDEIEEESVDVPVKKVKKKSSKEEVEVVVEASADIPVKKAKKKKSKHAEKDVVMVENVAVSKDAVLAEVAAPVEPVMTEEEVKAAVTLLLFYAYVEPEWTKREYTDAIAWAKDASARHEVSGRLRVAPEGFNGTMTGSYHGMRAFCQEMREWKPVVFGKTEFKLTDGLRDGLHFGGELKVMEIKELVNYGLKECQPKLKNGGIHLAAKDYHLQMQKPDTVIIDIRNSYEADIGRFNPPEGMCITLSYI
jgi:hypothetical protein